MNKNIGDFPYHTYHSNGIWKNEDTWVAYEGGYTQQLPSHSKFKCPNSYWVQGKQKFIMETKLYVKLLPLLIRPPLF